MKPRAYSYTRFSSLAQAGGDSVRRQTAAAKQWCDAHDVALIEDFADLGVSAFKGKNATGGALGAFMALAESGRISSGSFLLVESLDRIARTEITTAVTLILRIISAGVTVVTLTDGAIYDSGSVNAEPTKLIVSITILMRAHEESLTKSKRVRAAWKRKHELARKGVIATRGPSWTKRTCDGWRVVEPKAQIVRRIFDEVCAGKSLTGIMRRLNDEKVTTLSKGKRWSVQTISRLIDGRTALGEYQPHETNDGKREPIGAPIVDYYPAIIEPAQWANAQIVRRSHGRQRGGGRSPMINAFRGVIFTPHGEPLHAQKSRSSTGKDYTYLRANYAHTAALKGRVKSWNYDDFKVLFILLFERAKESAIDAPNCKRVAERLQFEIDAVKAKESNLARVLSNGYIEAVESELRKLGDERKTLEERLLGAAASPAIDHVGSVKISDDATLGENVRAFVRRIVVDASERCFSVETLTGEIFECWQEDGKTRFKGGGNAVAIFPREKSA